MPVRAFSAANPGNSYYLNTDNSGLMSANGQIDQNKFTILSDAKSFQEILEEREKAGEDVHP